VNADSQPPTRTEAQSARQRRRDSILAEYLDRGRRDGLRAHRSIKCGQYDNHADRDGGCANDGSTCICECHDLQPAEVSR
jgi:hypothetical protein